uniref:Zpu1 n=1 Tax=Arundo donax TaxID=35708 RepID=A0A0A9DJY2_ARUDO
MSTEITNMQFIYAYVREGIKLGLFIHQFVPGRWLQCFTINVNQPSPCAICRKPSSIRIIS